MAAIASPAGKSWGRMRRLAVTVAVVLMLFATAVADRATGLFHLTVLYAIPIIVATWAAGLLGGLATATLALILVAVAHSLLHSPTLAADIGTDLAVFLVAVLFVDRLRAQLLTIRALESRRDFDLGLARDIQQRMLRRPPRDDRFRIAFALHFAREVGGDYYRFQEADGKLFLFAGDIAGKGMSAALFAMLLDETIGDSLGRSRSVESIAEAVNRRMYATMPPEMFVTMLLAQSDRSGFSFVNAGHVRPLLLVDASGDVLELAQAATIPLGIEPEIDARAASLRVSRHDMLLVCSDGVTESPALFSRPELLSSVFLEHAEQGPQAIVDAVSSLAESRGQTDDVTVICLKWE